MRTSEILIISDDPRLLEALTAQLAAEGCSVTRARGPVEGIDAARERRPDLILLDLPGSPAQWAALLAKIQRGKETRAVPVVALTDGPVPEGELLTVFDAIAKPADPARLREDLTLVRRRKGKHPPAPGPIGDEIHRLFADYLETETGLHFDQRNLRLLERGLRSRMTALKIGSYADYFDFLVRHGEARGELAKLLTFLTVGETSFFRYPYHFDALRRQILPGIAAVRGRGERRLRIWSAGCSTGEEPYSLAMIVMEAIADWRAWDIRIIATDLNVQALGKARTGIYGARTLRGVPPEYLHRHFSETAGLWRVNDEVRRLVQFGVLNLKADPFPSPGEEGQGFDVILCRNVMIYFELPTMERLVARFAESLAPGGHLFLGHSESLLQLSSRFERLSHGGGFYYRCRDGHLQPPRPPVRPATAPLPPQPPVAPRLEAPASVPRPALPRKPRPTPEPARPIVPAAAAADGRDLFAEAQTLFAAEEYGGAASLLGELLAREPGHIGALLTMGTIHANGGRFDEALTVCARVQTLDDLVPEAYFLRGLVLEAENRPAEAQEEYRKAVLLDMEAVMPHYALGRLYRRVGRERDGVRELRNALRCLERLPEGSAVPFAGGLEREAFMELLRRELA